MITERELTLSEDDADAALWVLVKYVEDAVRYGEVEEAPIENLNKVIYAFEHADRIVFSDEIKDA